MSDSITPNGDARPNGHDPAPSPQSLAPSSSESLAPRSNEPLAPSPKSLSNCANAQHSTGPRTEEGKKRSSLNALRHGLTGHTIVLPSEDLAAYERHVQSFADEYQPQGATERQLVQDLADTAWRINRIPALENNLLTLAVTEHADSINVSHPEAQDALAMAKALVENHKALASLSMHGQRLSRQFQKSRELLVQIQHQRKRKEERELERAADLVEMHQVEEQPYQPAEDGFVFSNEEIESFIQQRDREHRAYQARPYRYHATA